MPFVIRVRKNAHLTSRGCTKRAGTWIWSLPVGAVQRRRRRVGSYGHRLFLTSLKRESDDLFVVSDHPFEDALGVYGKRWGIETLFSCLKSRGFNLETTHVRDDERVQTRRVQLWLLALLAFSFAFLVGAYLVDRQPDSGEVPWSQGRECVPDGTRSFALDAAERPLPQGGVLSLLTGSSTSTSFVMYLGNRL